MIMLLYFIFLIWLIDLKLSFPILDFLDTRHVTSLNLTPFQNTGGTFEIAMNVIAFLPLGGLLAAASRKWRFDQQLLAVLLTSLCLEGLQYALAIGAADITDVINNTFGGLLGIGIFLLIKKLFGEKAASVLAILVSIAIVVLGVLISQTDLLGIRMIL